MSATDPFGFLYNADERDRRHFEGEWIGPATFEPWQETLIATYEAESNSDGQTVEVYCLAAPARFYKLKVLAGNSSIGTPQSAYEVTTGSDQSELVALLAKKIQEGMIGFKPETELPLEHPQLKSLSEAQSERDNAR